MKNTLMLPSQMARDINRAADDLWLTTTEADAGIEKYNRLYAMVQRCTDGAGFIVHDFIGEKCIKCGITQDERKWIMAQTT